MQQQCKVYGTDVTPNGGECSLVGLLAQKFLYLVKDIVDVLALMPCVQKRALLFLFFVIGGRLVSSQ